jgi:hypothetical protein
MIGEGYMFAQIEREKGKLDIEFANASAAKYPPLASSRAQPFLNCVE